MGMNNIPSVLLGGHQGTVLGPVLFMLFVNDPSSEISSTVKLYSDDNKVSREISNITKYTDALQSDLVRLKGRSDTWWLDFNVSKSEVMRVTRAQDKSVRNYTLVPHGEQVSGFCKRPQHYKLVQPFKDFTHSWGG